MSGVFSNALAKWALVSLLFAPALRAEEVEVSKTYNLDKINGAIAGVVSEILKPYKDVTGMDFKFNEVTVADKHLSGKIDATVGFKKSKWAETATEFNLNLALHSMLVKPANGADEGVSKSELLARLSLKTDALALFRYIGTSLWSEEDCGPNAKEPTAECKPLAVLKNAKSMGDIKVAFDSMKSIAINGLKEMIAELEAELKKYPAGSDDWKNVKEQLDGMVAIKTIIESISIVAGANDSLSVTLKDLYWDKQNKDGIRVLSLQLSKTGASLSVDLAVTDNAQFFTETKTSTEAYLAKLESGDKAAVDEIKDLVGGYLDFALGLVVGKEEEAAVVTP